MQPQQDISGRRPPGARLRAGIQRYRDVVTVTVDDLPRLRVVLAFPALLLVLGAILIGLGINGSSSGALYHQVYVGEDPALIAGAPESIRSDEWNVGVPWTINQLQQGLPNRNETFPGGMDPEIPFSLPQRQPSVVFQPQLLGFLALPLDQGMAWKWWLPALALIAGCYVFLLTLLPRRPLVAAALAVAFFFSPFIQWWYETSVMWPIFWAVVTMAAMLWSMKSQSRWARWIWALPVAYSTATMAFGIYAPFIIPVVVVVAFFAVALLVEQLRRGRSFGAVAFRYAPVLIGGLIGATITALWLRSKAATVAGFIGTVYPGQRLTPAGSGTAVSALRTIGSAFAQSLQFGAGFIGANSSEASSFFLAGAFLIPVTAWIVWRASRRHGSLPWLQLGLCASLVLFVAFTFVPGWNAVAHVLFLDLSTPDRMRIGIGLASFALVGVIVRDLDAAHHAAPRRIAVLASILFLGSQLAIAAAVQVTVGPAKLWGAAPLWLPIAVLSAASIYWFARRYVTLAALAVLVIGVVTCGLVNPVYHGVFDLRKTAVARAILSVNDARPGGWVGLGDALPTAMLLETGVREYNGTQGVPSRTMWKQIDPTSAYMDEWNRLGSVRWTAGTGQPTVSNPAADVILVTFDACAGFSQHHIAHVLSNSSATLVSPCLRLRTSVKVAHSTMSIYDVIK